MSNFNKLYFESDSHWADGMLTDNFNSERIKATRQLIPSDVRSLLDVGCGNGVFLNSLMHDHPDMQLMGLDRSTTALKYVQAQKIEGDISDIPFENASFDCVTSLEVIEHLQDGVFRKALSELTRVSRKYIIISVPFNEVLENNFTKCPSCKAAFNRDLHVRSFSEDEFGNILRDFGYNAVTKRKVGEITTYVGHSEFRRLFRTEEFYKWNVPICPVCGFQQSQPAENGENKAFSNGKSDVNHSFTKMLLRFPKMLWPKATRNYWIMGLFVKSH